MQVETKEEKKVKTTLANVSKSWTWITRGMNALEEATLCCITVYCDLGTAREASWGYRSVLGVCNGELDRKTNMTL